MSTNLKIAGLTLAMLSLFAGVGMLLLVQVINDYTDS